MFKKKISRIIAATFIFGVFLTTCEIPMGLGDPVDTVPPTVYIDSPEDNTKMKAISQGNPIIMEGVWFDNFGVYSLQFEIIDRWNNNKPVIPISVKPEIKKTSTFEGLIQGTWRAEIVIDASILTEYGIRVYALDNFGNRGIAEVNVRIDIIPPWIDSIKIQRHPNSAILSLNGANAVFTQDSETYTIDDTGSTSGKKDSLPNRQYYIDKGFDTNDSDLWRKITYEDINKFQNEFFRITTRIDSIFSNVGAVRLNIYDESEKLLTETSLVPTGYSIAVQSDNTHLQYPYWDITHALLVGLNSMYNSGLHYISFEIRAWSDTDWDMTNNIPKLDEYGQPEQGRSQRAGGTMWFPESDNPHPYIDESLIIGNTNTLTLTSNNNAALKIDFYDDDLLSNINYGLISKADLDVLLAAINPTPTEVEYFDSLATNSARQAAVLAKCITANPSTERFTSTAGTTNTYRTFDLRTGAVGEYRLIAFVREGAKNTPNYSFPNTAATQKWSVYPRLRIQVQDAESPLVIVENPLKENAFPNLRSDGQTFDLTGYTLSTAKADRVLIAWTPPGKTSTEANTALTDAENALGQPSLWTSGYFIHSSGVKVWNVAITDLGTDVFGSKTYYKVGFTKNFDILTDFVISGVNQFKGASNVNAFVIKAFSSALSSSTSKTFRMYGTVAAPIIDVISHTSIQSYQDIEKDLTLIMQVNKGDGIALKTDTIKITDTNTGSPSATATTPYGVGNLNFNAGNGIAQATVTSTYIKANFAEGSNRIYRFTAENILGNSSTADRTIIMSNNPLIESISCTNGSGTYKEGDVLTFEVTYSMPVMVTGTPRLKLHFGDVTSVTANTAPSAYATYVVPSSTTASNTLQFTYTVGLNHETPLLKNSLYPIDKSLANTTLKSYMGSDAVTSIPNHNNSMQTKQTVILDGVHPKVLRASFKQDGNGPTGSTRYFNNGKTITIELLCSEKVMISGSPSVTINVIGETNLNLTANFSSKDTTGTIITFTHTINNTSISQERQLTWGTPWITFATGDSITDEVGNTIDVSTTALPAEANRRGATGSGYTDDKTAYIKTTTPATPVLSIYSTQAGAQNDTTGVLLSATPLNTNGNYLYMRAKNIATTGSTYTVYYSLTGGSNPKSNLAGTGDARYSNVTTGASKPGDTGWDTSAFNSIADLNYANRNNQSLYTPTSYQVTVWQVDRAGNESAKSTSRDITINSRPAELNGIEIPLNDGAYAEGTVVPFKFSFSQKITANASASVTIEIKGVDSLMNGTAQILSVPVPQTTTQNPATSMITVNWTIPETAKAMKNIKVTNIQFNNMVDEYGNALTRYNGSAADNGLLRPIGDNVTTYPFQLDRGNLIFLSSRPRLTDTGGGKNTDPVVPNGAGNQQNGGLIPSDGVLKLVFVEGQGVAVPLTAVAGKYITIRPYGTWAIPPELTVDEFNTVYNFDYGTNNTTYRRRLSDVDSNGIPKSGSGRGTGYNLYIKNTHGLLTQGTNLRPDTTTKMVLDFTTDLYDSTNANNLRTIFNAAGWKQQKILATSSNVNIVGNVINITPPAPLDNGRIWEVVIEDGAFQDDARHLSQEVTGGAYRFWSRGTAVPFIRADKVSYDARNILDNGHADLAFVDGTTVNLPPVDTLVRIDCETPGATIRYDVIRTSYTLNPGGNQYTSDAFTSTTSTNSGFFNHSPNYTSTTDGGYTNNSIGNMDVTTNKTDGFYNQALVPIKVDTGTATLTNGTFPIATLSNLGANIAMTGNVTGNQKVYQSLNATTGAITFNSTDNGNTGGNPLGDVPYRYIGELYPGSTTTGGTTNVAPTSANAAGRRAKSGTDVRLFSGRRDYIVAKAQKLSVNGTGGNIKNSGPQLDASAPGMEGVYKTVLLYRDPQTRRARILVQGFDNPVMPIVAGFPLRDADSTNTDQNAYNNIFSKNAWRYGVTTAVDFETAPAAGNVNNMHIWVTWEIVTDWYQKGKGFSSATSGNYLNNGSNNANSVGATYGSVIYRYRQDFYN